MKCDQLIRQRLFQYEKKNVRWWVESTKTVHVSAFFFFFFGSFYESLLPTLP